MKKLFRINLILSAIVGVLAFSSFTFSSNRQEYPYLEPHPYWCNLFYYVEFMQPRILHSCPYGLCFDETWDTCDWPDLADHGDRECRHYYL